MTTPAPGTPKSVMDEVNRKWEEYQTTMTPSDGRMVTGLVKPPRKLMERAITMKPTALVTPTASMPPKPPVAAKPKVTGPDLIAQSKMRQQQKAQNMGRVGMAKGGKVSSASKRGDGIAQRGRTKGRMV